MQRTFSPTEILSEAHQAGPSTPISFIQLWMAEQTAPGHTYTQILHANYRRWMAQHHADPLPIQTFGVALKLLGIERQRDRRGSLIALSIKPNATRLQRQQVERGRQRARLNRFFRS